MKNLIVRFQWTKIQVLTLLALLSINAFSQQLLTPLKGQFFEQGYGQNEEFTGDEESVDITFNTVGETFMCGWVENLDYLAEGISETHIDAAFWRINQFGKQLNFKAFKGNLNEEARGITLDNEASVAVCIRKSNDFDNQLVSLGDSIVIIKFDTSGNPIFTKSIGYQNDEELSFGIAPIDIVTDSEGDFIVLANKISTIPYQFESEYEPSKIEPVLIKISNSGTIVWTREYTNEEHSIEAQELLIRSDETIQFTANNKTSSPYPSVFLFEDDGSFSYKYNYTQLSNIEVIGIAQHVFGDYYLAGTKNDGDETDGYLIKLDEDYNYLTSIAVGT